MEAARFGVERARTAIEAGEEADAAALAGAEIARVAAGRPRRIINATGVLLHTNLGRAPWPAPAVTSAAEAARHYGNIEFDLDGARRGGRGGYVRSLLQALTGAGDALVVNNNAGALFLALAALAGGRDAVVSRGELIEIGGSFRLPELMAASGARLLEVGTTNRTRLADYEAVAGRAALLLKVHPSNYRIEGFTEEADYSTLADLARRHDIPLVADVGSGLLDARVPWLDGAPPSWLADEAAVRQTLEAGAGVVLFSGDKLLGGPQAGIAVGGGELIADMARHPVARAVRCDGSTLAALASVLELYADGRGAEIPFWAMASLPYEELEVRANNVLAAAAVDGRVLQGSSIPGAGSVPRGDIPSPIIHVPGQPDPTWKRLLAGRQPVLARREDEGLVIDLRAVAPVEDEAVAAALAEACR